MERTGRQNRQPSIHAPLSQRCLRIAGLLLIGAVTLSGCYVVPAPGPAAYVAPAPVYVAPAPVYVRPVPAYGWYGYRYGWGRHGRW
jgi:hypothetical protein